MEALGRWKAGSWQIQTLVGHKPAEALFPKQVHGGIILRADHLSNTVKEGDGMYSSAQTKHPIGIVTADCLPLVILSKTAALALHVSRKSILRGLLESTEEYIDPNRIAQIWIGPHICADHLTYSYAGAEIQDFQARFPDAVTRRNNQWHLSLRQAVSKYLKKWGVSESSIIEMNTCTYEQPDLPSYRRCLDQNQKLVEQLFTVIEPQ